MSLLEAAEVREHVETSLTDYALQTLIDAEESRLARRIGALRGELVETFEPAKYDFVVLTRPTTTADVTVDSVEVDATLRSDGRTLVPDLGYWTGTVEVTYTPTDTDEVRSVLIELIRLAVTDTAYITESTDSYSYQQDYTVRARRREGLIRSLLPSRQQFPMSVRLLSSVNP